MFGKFGLGKFTQIRLLQCSRDASGNRASIGLMQPLNSETMTVSDSSIAVSSSSIGLIVDVFGIGNDQ
jgi:hypothetical protein